MMLEEKLFESGHSLSLALSAANLRYLPAQRSDGDVRYWSKALVRVRKLGGSINFAIAHRGGDGIVRYTRDFGLMRPVVAILNIYPYQWVDYDVDGWGSDDDDILRSRLIDFFRTHLMRVASTLGLPGSREYDNAVHRCDRVIGELSRGSRDVLHRYDIDRIVIEMDTPHVGSHRVLSPESSDSVSSSASTDMEDSGDNVTDGVVSGSEVVRNVRPKRRVRGGKTAAPRKPRRVPKNAITGEEDGKR